MENSENVNVATLLECLCDIVIGSLNHTLDREGRYIVEVDAVDDEGNKFELAPDPMNEEITEQLGDIVIGKPETFKDQLKPILSNERLFFTDLYKDGVGEKIEDMFREMIVGPGAVKATIHKYVK